MGRIRGWEKASVGKDLNSYVNISNLDEKGKIVLFILKTRDIRLDDTTIRYEIILINGANKTLLRTFSTKTEAQKFAIQWMRKHPRG